MEIKTGSKEWVISRYPIMVQTTADPSRPEGATILYVASCRVYFVFSGKTIYKTIKAETHFGADRAIDLLVLEVNTWFETWGSP